MKSTNKMRIISVAGKRLYVEYGVVYDALNYDE